MEASKQCIGLYGGTFDPVHNGHISAVNSFLRSGKIDSLWILLNPAPPHKPDETFVPYSYRLSMLNEAFKSNKEAKISDLETQLPAPTYTVQTVRYLTSKYPRYEFCLCIGYDSYVTFHHWHEWEKILEFCNLLVVRRPDYEGKRPNQKVADHSTFVEHQPVEVSSSEIRDKIEAGENINKLVPQNVLRIIEDHKLYK